MLQLDDWVLCRIYNKKGILEKYDNVVDFPEDDDQKPEIMGFSQNEMLAPQPTPPPQHFDTPESVPRWHTDSSCSSDQMLSSPEFAPEKEAQSGSAWDDLDFQLNNFMTAFAAGDPLEPQMQLFNDQFNSFSDMLFPMQ